MEIIFDGNGVDIVFDEEKDGILKTTYQGAGRINRAGKGYSVVSVRLWMIRVGPYKG